MKVLTAFPTAISHINQWTCKRVRVKENAAELYANDSRWRHQDNDPQRPFARLSCTTILSKIAGTECEVIATWMMENRTIMYGLLFEKPIEAPNDVGILMLHNKGQFPMDYFEVLDSGFMEAQ